MQAKTSSTTTKRPKFKASSIPVTSSTANYFKKRSLNWYRKCKRIWRNRKHTVAWTLRRRFYIKRMTLSSTRKKEEIMWPFSSQSSIILVLGGPTVTRQVLLILNKTSHRTLLRVLAPHLLWTTINLAWVDLCQSKYPLWWALRHLELSCLRASLGILTTHRLQ